VLEVPPKVLHLPITTRKGKDLALTHVADIVLELSFRDAILRIHKVRAFRTDQASEDGMLCVQDSVRRVLRHRSRSPAPAEYVTIVFEDQKKGRDGCPHPTAIGPQIPLPRIALGICHSADHRDHSRLERADNAMLCHTRGRPSSGNAFVRKLLRHTALIFGDLKHSGSTEIGNKSIRSGAAMALFLMDHSLQNYDPWPLVLGCISGLHSTPGPRMDQ
jgi:hypothetical protein